MNRIYTNVLHFIDCFDKTQLVKQNIHKQGYVAPSLKSLLQKLYGREHEQVDRKYQYL
jgi:hypothetical protein